jgi:hypothetical protein
VHEPTAAEKEAWEKVFKAAREKLAKGVFKADLMKRVEDLVAKK